MKTWDKNVPLLNPNNGLDCDAQIQELKCSDTVTSSTVNVLNIVDAGYCGKYPGRSGGFLYTISVVSHKSATFLTCNYETEFDKKNQVFQDSIVGNCVAGNGCDHNCGVKSCVIFNTVDTETYIVHVTVYEYSDGKFTLSVECAASTCEKIKQKEG